MPDWLAQVCGVVASGGEDVFALKEDCGFYNTSKITLIGSVPVWLL